MSYLLQYHITVLVLIVCFTSTRNQSLQSYYESRSCPPWFIPQDDRDGYNCTCGSSLRGVVSCTDQVQRKVTLTQCYCMTSSEEEFTNDTVVGKCPYTCLLSLEWYPDPAELDYHMCSKVWKRTGLLCSKCMESYGPPVYSYGIQCVQCPSKQRVLLFLGPFLVLTIFCLTIMILRISIARPPMSTFVLVSQVMASPHILQYMFMSEPSYISPIFTHSAHQATWSLFAGFYGLWNLDILRSFYPQICLSPRMTTLHAVLLEYLVAIFPLLMVFVIYYSVKLYDRGYRAIFCVCRPVHTCLARLRRSIDIHTSLIDAFATFIILSVNKVGYTSFSILQPVYVYSPYGNHSLCVYLDPTMEYFGWHHLPYALTALVFVFTLILVPLLLLFLYPLRCFQTFLNNCGWQCQVLHVFADSFQGCYKDGTTGTRDYRWFAGVNILMRFTFTVIPLELARNSKPLAYSFMIIGVALYMSLLAIFQPYKKPVHLKQDMVLLLGLLLWYSAMLDGALSMAGWDLFDIVLHMIILVIGSLIPVVYIAGLIFHWLLVVKKVHIWILRKIRFSSE